MKNRIGISVLCICILLTALGCGADAVNEELLDESLEPAAATESDQEEQTEAGGHDNAIPVSESNIDTENEVLSDESKEPAAAAESDQEEQTKRYDQYEELITAAKECIEGKDEESEEYDFSYIIYLFGPYYGASAGLGYLIEDIDGNGSDELIFGQNSTPGTAADGIIYDLYTISDGELVHVFDGGERSTYYLCENGMIANEGADGAAMSVYAYYTFEGAEIYLVEAVLYNGWGDNSDAPWFYSKKTDSYYDTENLESISEEQARTIMEKYVYEHPKFTPFVEE